MNFTGVKRSVILLHERRFATKRNFTTEKIQFEKNDTYFVFKIFRNFSIVTHLGHRPPSKIHRTIYLNKISDELVVSKFLVTVLFNFIVQ